MFKAFLYFELLLFLLAGATSCTTSKKKKPNTKTPPKFAVINEPIFSNDGNLWFTDINNDTIARIEIEIADNEAKRETGLMHRKLMKNSRGMLFIFPDEKRRLFWMKETHIPLDIIFVNAERNIIHIAENTQPYSLKQIPSFEYAQYVVEVNAGYCKKKSINTDCKIDFKINFN